MISLRGVNSFISRLSKREKLVLYGAAIVVFFTVVDRLIVYPISYRIKALNDDIKDKESGIKKNLHILALKDRILSETAKYYGVLTKPKSDEEEISGLLKEVENIANKTSIYLVDMKPVEPKSVGAFKKYSINLNCEGQMEQVLNFMHHVESSIKFLSVEKYQVAPKSKGSSVAKCNMVIVKMVLP